MRRAVGMGALVLVAACGGDAPPEDTSGSTTSTAGAAASGGSGAGGAGAAGGAGGDAEGGAAGGCTSSLPDAAPATDALSETGLYSDTRKKELAPWIQPFAPRFVLWSDGATKERYLYLPECASIDTSDLDDWSFPVGTRVWKSFSRDGTLIETRLIQRTGAGAFDWFMMAYLWNEDGSEAIAVPAGVADAKGTPHDVPAVEGCRQCHGALDELGGGRPSRLLGVSALQLAHDGAGLTLDDLVAQNRVSHPPVGAVEVPGDPVAQAALGMLHANCGNCHNSSSDGVAQLDLDLWLPVGASDVESTPSYLTSVGQPTQGFSAPFINARIAPGEPASSALYFRMGERGNNAMMPPLGTEISDGDGLAALEAWILSLP